MNRGQSKTAEARARRGIRKSADDAEVLDPDDPEFDAKLDASIERAYERIEAELDRMIEDLRSLPNRARADWHRVGTKIPARLRMRARTMAGRAD